MASALAKLLRDECQSRRQHDEEDNAADGKGRAGPSRGSTALRFSRRTRAFFLFPLLRI